MPLESQITQALDQVKSMLPFESIYASLISIYLLWLSFESMIQLLEFGAQFHLRILWNSLLEFQSLLLLRYVNIEFQSLLLLTDLVEFLLSV
jgi:hypothetical protein